MSDDLQLNFTQTVNETNKAIKALDQLTASLNSLNRAKLADAKAQIDAFMSSSQNRTGDAKTMLRSLAKDSTSAMQEVAKALSSVDKIVTDAGISTNKALSNSIAKITATLRESLGTAKLTLQHEYDKAKEASYKSIKSQALASYGESLRSGGVFSRVSFPRDKQGNLSETVAGASTELSVDRKLVAEATVKAARDYRDALREANRESKVLASGISENIATRGRELEQAAKAIRVSKPGSAGMEELARLDAANRASKSTYWDSFDSKEKARRDSIRESYRIEKVEGNAALNALNVEHDAQKALYARLEQYKADKAKERLQQESQWEKNKAAERSELSKAAASRDAAWDLIDKQKALEVSKAFAVREAQQTREKEAGLRAIAKAGREEDNRIRAALDASAALQIQGYEKALDDSLTIAKSKFRNSQRVANESYRQGELNANFRHQQALVNQAIEAGKSTGAKALLSRMVSAQGMLGVAGGESAATKKFGSDMVEAVKSGATERLAGAVATLGKNTGDATPKLFSLSNALKSLGGDMNTAHSAARGLASGFGLLWLTWGQMAPLLAGSALSFGIAKSYQQAKELSLVFADIQYVAGTAAEDMTKLKAAAVDSANGAAGPLEMAKGMRSLALAGLDAKEQLDALSTVRAFSNVGNVNIEKSAESLVAIGSAFGYKAKEFGVVADVIGAAAASSMASIENMTEAFKASSVIAQTYGVDIKDVAASLALLANIGITGSAAGTAVRQMYVELTGATAKGKKTLKEFGIEVWDLQNNKMKGLPDILGQLTSKLSGLRIDQQIELLQRLGNERGLKSLSADLIAFAQNAASTGKDVQTEFAKIADAINNAAGFTVLADIGKRQAFGYVFKQTAADIERSLVKAFSASEGAATRLMNTLGNIFSSDRFVGAVTELIDVVTRFGQVMADHIDVIIGVGKAYLAYKLVMLGLVATSGLVTLATQATLLAGAMRSKGVAMSIATVAAEGLSGGLKTLGASAATASFGMTALGAAIPIIGIVGGLLSVGATAYALFGDKAKDALTKAKENSEDFFNSTSKNLQEEIKRLKDKTDNWTLYGNAITAAADAKERMLVADLLEKRAAGENEIISRMNKATGRSSIESGAIPLSAPYEKELDDYRARTKQMVDIKKAEVKQLLELAKKDEEQSKLSRDARNKREAGTGMLSTDEDMGRIYDNSGKINAAYSRDLGLQRKLMQDELDMLGYAHNAKELSDVEFYVKRTETIKRFNDEADKIETASLNKLYKEYTSVYKAIGDQYDKEKDPKKRSNLNERLTALGEAYDSSASRIIDDSIARKSDETKRLAKETYEATAEINRMVKANEEWTQSYSKRVNKASAVEAARAAAEKQGPRAVAIVEAQMKVQEDFSERIASTTTKITELTAEQAKYDELATASGGNPEYIEMYRRKGLEIEKLRIEIAKLSKDEAKYISKAGTTAGAKFDSDQLEAERQKLATSWKTTSKDIADSLFDAIIGVGDKSGKKLRDQIQRALMAPLRLFLDPIINDLAATIATALNPTGAAAAAQGAGTGKGSAFSALSAGKSVFDALNNGVSTSIANGFAKLASNSAGEKLGVSYYDGNAYQLTGVGAQLGQVLGAVGGAAAGVSLKNAISGGFKVSNFADAIGTAVSLWFGPIGGIASGLFNRAFGKKYDGSGIAGTFGAGNGFSGYSYTDYEGGWFSSGGRDTSALDPRIVKQLSNQFQLVKTQAALQATTLGASADALVNFTHSFAFATDGLNGDQINAQIKSAFEGAGEAMAQLILGTTEYSQVGETAAATLSRLSGGLNGVNSAMLLLGKVTYSASMQSAQYAQNIINAVGSQSEFESAVRGYFDAFYSNTDKSSSKLSVFTSELSKLGISTVPMTRQAFRQLVDAQDLTTESGQAVYGGLLKLSSAFIDMTSAAVSSADSLMQAAEKVMKDASPALTLQQQIGQFDKNYTLALSTSGTTQAEYLTKLADALPDISTALKENSATREQWLSSVSVLANKAMFAAKAVDPTLTIPAFASGGYHRGGYRLVGEDGPEIEATGPAMYYNASQTKSMLGGSDDGNVSGLIKELIAQIDLLRYETRATATHTAKMAKLQNDWDGRGLLIRNDADTPITTHAV